VFQLLGNRLAIDTRRKSWSAARAPRRYSPPMPQPATFATHKYKAVLYRQRLVA